MFIVNAFMAPKRKLHKQNIQNEICECGHLKTEHYWFATNELSSKLRGVKGLTEGTGFCLKCGCGQFTWKAFLLKDGTIYK